MTAILWCIITANKHPEASNLIKYLDKLINTVIISPELYFWNGLPVKYNIKYKIKPTKQEQCLCTNIKNDKISFSNINRRLIVY